MTLSILALAWMLQRPFDGKGCWCYDGYNDNAQCQAYCHPNAIVTKWRCNALSIIAPSLNDPYMVEWETIQLPSEKPAVGDLLLCGAPIALIRKCVWLSPKDLQVKP